MGVSNENLDAAMTGLRLAYANQEADYSPLGKGAQQHARKTSDARQLDREPQDATDAALNCARRETET